MLTQELLASSLDLGMSSVHEEGELVLRVISKPGWIRCIIGSVFAVPAGYLLFHAVFSSMGPSMVMVSCFLIPFLCLMSALFGLSRIEKSFDRSARSAASSVSCLGFRLRDTIPLKPKGVVHLKSEWDLDGVRWEFSLTIEHLPGMGFCGSTYDPILLFGRKLARFLDYRFVDGTSLKSRASRAV